MYSRAGKMAGVVFVLWGLLGPAGIAAGEAASRPAATATASAPATRPAPLDPAVERILDRLEKRTVTDLEGEIVYIKRDPILEDEQKFQGVLLFLQDKPNPRFFIRFDRVVHEGITQEKKEWHVFDGEWYIEARERTETITRRQIVRPGEKLDVFQLGQGPFPLPFGQKKENIVKHFAVKLVPSRPDDPKGTKDTDHLECTPLPDTEMDRKYGKVHFYIDRVLDLPVCVQTVEKEEGKEITATFSSIKVNKGLAASRLNLPDLKYEPTTIPLPEPERGKPP